jgi:hypothetical protein
MCVRLSLPGTLEGLFPRGLFSGGFSPNINFVWFPPGFFSFFLILNRVL